MLAAVQDPQMEQWVVGNRANDVAISIYLTTEIIKLLLELRNHMVAFIKYEQSTIDQWQFAGIWLEKEMALAICPALP